MPSYGAIEQNLAVNGALVQVHFGLYPTHAQAMQAEKKAVPSPVPARALVDTGAGLTAIKQGLLAPLGIQPVGVVPMSSATHANIMCLQYAVTMHFPAAVVNMAYWGTVVEMSIPFGVDCLIGRDVLSHGILVYSGITKSWTFSL